MSVDEVNKPPRPILRSQSSPNVLQSVAPPEPPDSQVSPPESTFFGSLFGSKPDETKSTNTQDSSIDTAETNSTKSTNTQDSSIDTAETDSTKSTNTQVSSIVTDSNIDKLSVNLYSYNDPLLGGVVKIKISGVEETTESIPEDAELINSKNYNEKISGIMKNINNSENMAGNFNRDISEGLNKGKFSRVELKVTTPESAIAKLRVVSLNGTEDEKKKILELITWLGKQNKDNQNWMALDFENNGNAKLYFDSIVAGKNISAPELKPIFDPSEKQNKVKDKLSVLSDTLEGPEQKRGVKKAKGEISKISSASKLDKIMKNIESLIVKAIQNKVLYIAKGLMRKQVPMDAKDVYDTIMNTGFFGGKNTRKNKKSKTQKRGRKNKNTKKH
jgi:hypothetical protein